MIRIIQGDCREVLKTLPDCSVQAVCTRPPYYGLRDYGTGTWEGGDPGCSHVVVQAAGRGKRDCLQHDTYRSPSGWTNRDATPPRQCSCGAIRVDRQIGLEATPDEFIATMVQVFREVRRVLRDDGTLWLNLGDSYASTGGKAQPHRNNNGGFSGSDGQRTQGYALAGGGFIRPNTAGSEVKPKDLLMIPARVALALQADGWYLRSDIIWSKLNPMPESVTDRPTSAHEHVFLLTKNARYFFDAEAVKEPGTIPAGTLGAKGSEERFNTPGVNSRPPEYKVYDGTRNIRNVWTIATAPYTGAHFATFPPALAERCIKAGTSEHGCCAQCGAPWVREVERVGGKIGTSWHDHTNDLQYGQRGGASGYKGKDRKDYENNAFITTGWSPSCGCTLGECFFPDCGAKIERGCMGCQGKSVVPCTVLDPFAGVFTTAMVADRLQRNAIGIELNPADCDRARDRIVKDAGMFADITDDNTQMVADPASDAL